MSRLTLYSYFRSSAAYRVRIVLGLKDLDYQQIAIHLVSNGGEQHAASYRAINPQGLVPSLQHDEAVLTQSTAICEYIDEVWPAPALLPRAPLQRAYVRSLMAAIACEIHPINNLRVLDYLTGTLQVSDADKLTWYRHWVSEGFGAIQRLIEGHGYAGRYCCGDEPGLADAFLIPQIFNARRFDMDLRPFSRLVEIDQACAELSAFQAAHPDRQPDTPQDGG
ncbi:MAG TPA: maleylacetoacetate isomerase [Dongiaceae bacterium]|nr:maleylacetoacetate isomerase [Dongiaceae bacterium]